MTGFYQTSLKKRVLKILEEDPLFKAIENIKGLPSTKVVSVLIGAFLHREEVVRWKAIACFGVITKEIADKDLERARVVIRRLMWMLNEESGSMAWGVPEGFAEAMFHSEVLRKEYLSIYVSYLWDPKEERKYKADNYLEFPPAQRGVVWGIGRLAQAKKEDLLERKAHLYVYQHLFSQDKVVSFLSLWSLSQFSSDLSQINLDPIPVKERLERFRQEGFRILMFDGHDIGYKTAESLVFRV
ncbi:hypothetical protein F1847_00990 [Thermodesulfobacterium sp. TA1]|uniref:DVU0298 family protein n=1 Tax=Thermodesulfobacterium sp. TA1 TaxID=2234087 RepID=UPI0012322073|nr:DVU0298 family protein [Thermodesulfobacterium sp. TA1]QER41383.1 hypothetical protein F1847_00990 [Thermodesulfobacterium sp. TA1]